MGRPITDFTEWFVKMGCDRVFEYPIESKLTVDDEFYILMAEGHQQYSEIMEMETEERRKFADMIAVKGNMYEEKGIS